MKYDGVHARGLIAQQHPDGTWGERFHTLSASSRAQREPTTEMALRRLEALGFTMRDDCIRRAVDYLDACLRGERSIPDPREKLHDWEAFTELMLAAWIRRFTPDNARANAVGEKWAGIIDAAFAGAEYDHAAYCAAFARALGHPPRGGRFVDFVNFYVVSVTAGLLREETETRMIDHVLRHEPGIYYVCEGPLCSLPETFAGKRAVRAIAGLAELARHPHSAPQLRFAAEWLEKNRGQDGQWDLTAAARDDVHLPLSDTWRRPENRRADCTALVQFLLDKLRT